MSIINLHTVPETTLIKNDATFLCVFDENKKLIGDYDFCTGLRLIKNLNGLTIYINDNDLIPGSWTLFLTGINKNMEIITEKIKGSKSGPPASRIFTNEDPWDKCSSGYEHVSVTERQERVAICTECPFLDPATMKCTITEKLVLDSTTKLDEFCPNELWGDKEQVLNKIAENAIAQGLVTTTETNTVNVEEQKQFESELDSYLEGL